MVDIFSYKLSLKHDICKASFPFCKGGTQGFLSPVQGPLQMSCFNDNLIEKNAYLLSQFVWNLNEGNQWKTSLIGENQQKRGMNFLASRGGRRGEPICPKKLLGVTESWECRLGMYNCACTTQHAPKVHFMCPVVENLEYCHSAPRFWAKSF